MKFSDLVQYEEEEFKLELKDVYGLDLKVTFENLLTNPTMVLDFGEVGNIPNIAMVNYKDSIAVKETFLDFIEQLRASADLTIANYDEDQGKSVFILIYLEKNTNKFKVIRKVEKKELRLFPKEVDTEGLDITIFTTTGNLVNNGLEQLYALKSFLHVLKLAFNNYLSLNGVEV